MTEQISNNTSQVDNKRIAKNTLMLYIRTLFVMVITLFTSRVILQSLGVEDYGIYNVVGGIISMLSFISSTLSTASQRYITFELGKGDAGNMNKIFSICLLLHFGLALIVALVAEPLGLWFINNKLLIPTERLTAAVWVFQFTVFSMIIMFLSVPFNALIVAHERMNAFAAISIVDAAMRLFIAYAILLCSSDKLIIYAFLMFVAQLTIQACYMIYCYRKFQESHYRHHWDRALVKEMGKFASWSVFGNLAFVSYTQGLNLLLGTFFLPEVNAARGIAVQVQSAVNHFVSSFQTAINPQITKNYAAGNVPAMISLVFRSSRFSFYLLMIMTIPILLETEILLKLWLKVVPKYSVPFLRIILITTWINSIANPLIISVKATGNIRKYESTIGGLMLLILPISYVFLRLGFPPITVFVVHLCMECIAMICRILITRSLIHFSLRKYISELLIRISVVGLVAIIIPTLLYYHFEASLLRFFIICGVSVICSGFTILLFGLTKSEREFITSKIKAKR